MTVHKDQKLVSKEQGNSEQRKNRGKLVLGQIFKQMARDRKHLEVLWVKYAEFLHIKQELHKKTQRFEVYFYYLLTKIVLFKGTEQI